MIHHHLIPDEHVQLILTDPPYGIRYQNQFALEPHRFITGDMDFDYTQFASECYRILADNAHAYFFTRFDQYPRHYALLTEAGFQVKNCLVISKGHVGGIGDLHGSYANNCEWLIFCHKGRRTFRPTKLLKNAYPVNRLRRKGLPSPEYKTRLNCCWFGSDYPKATYNASWTAKHGFRHPTIKNVGCLEWLIRISSDMGEIVLDPCMGSGSTALAAVNTGRRFLGSEVDAAYWELSQRRLAGAGNGVRSERSDLDK